MTIRGPIAASSQHTRAPGFAALDSFQGGDGSTNGKEQSTARRGPRREVANKSIAHRGSHPPGGACGPPSSFSSRIGESIVGPRWLQALAGPAGQR